MTALPAEVWDEFHTPEEPWYDLTQEEGVGYETPPPAEPTLADVEVALENIYGAERTARSRRARAQARDDKGRFCRSDDLAAVTRRAAQRAKKHAKAVRDMAQVWRNTALTVPQTYWRAEDPWQPLYAYGDRVVAYDFDTPTPVGWTTAATNANVGWNHPVTVGPTTAAVAANYIPVRWTTTGTVTQWRDMATATYHFQWNAPGGHHERRTYTDEFMAQNTAWRHWNVVGNRYVNAAEEEEAYRIQRAEYERLRQEAADRAQAQRERESRERLAKQQRYAGAEERAKELLMLILTPEEKLHYGNTGKVLVNGSEGGRYEVDLTYRGVHGNIVELDEHGCHMARLCVAPRMMDDEAKYALPLTDGYIGQILSLKHNEGEMKAKANYSHRRACVAQGVAPLRQAA